MTSTAKSQRQAYPLALALYRRGMLVIDLGIWIDGSDGPKPTHAMRYRDSRTGTPSAGKFAQRAYREAGVCEHTPPGPESGTWEDTRELLAWMYRNPGKTLRQPTPSIARVPDAPDLLDDRPRWGLEAQCVPPSPLTPSTPVPAASTTAATMTSAADAGTWSSAPPAEAQPATAAGRQPRRDADFPRKDGATCACGTWHRRYGPLGHGFLCDACRSKASAYHERR